MDWQAITEAVAKLGAVGILAAILIFVFFWYLPRQAKENREERDQARADCHTAQQKMQDEFVQTIRKIQTESSNTANKHLTILNEFRESVRDNTQATRELTRTFYQNQKGNG